MEGDRTRTKFPWKGPRRKRSSKESERKLRMIENETPRRTEESKKRKRQTSKISRLRGG